MNRRRRMNLAAGLALVTIALLWAGCSNNQSKPTDSVASLPDLPPADVATLKAVPNSKVLSTTVIKRAPLAAPGKIQPACAADDVTFTYSVQVEYPVTVCTPLNIPTDGTATGVFTGGLTPNYKLDNSKLPQDLQGVATPPSNAGSSPPQIIWQCKQDKGPWQGGLSSEHGCTISCNTDNLLTLLNTPNLIQFEWTGSIIEDRPPGLQFVGGLQQIDVTRNRCHQENVVPQTK